MDEKILNFIENIEKKIQSNFAAIDAVALKNLSKVLTAFKNNNLSYRHFAGTTGYGYDDIGRDTLGRIFAEIFHAESAIVSPLIVSGTHALTIALFGLLRPNDELVSISGKPYDTLDEVISGKDIGSLADYNVTYKQVELIGSDFDYEGIKRSLTAKTKVVFIGRSRGYAFRASISMESITEAIKTVKAYNPNIICMVDNCYGEFTQEIEPTDCGADICVGSLIKNIGGGLANNGGYVVGIEKYVDMVAARFTSPSIKTEVGSYSSGYLSIYQGLFLAPTVVANALKGSKLISNAYRELGYDVLPTTTEKPSDIVTAIIFNDKEKLINMCRTVQAMSPVDSNVTPEPWAMPGYDSEIIMAAGTFIQGASIELSCDSPIKPPYILYLQGGLTYEHVKLTLAECLKQEIK